MRLIYRLLAGPVAVLLGWAATGRAAEFDTASGIQIRWDTTLRTTLGLRLAGQNATLLANINGDDGDRAVLPGINSERIDALTSFDASKGDLGVDLSATGWYDQVYHQRSANNAPATFNPVSVPHTGFPASVRAQQGGDGELLTANIRDTLRLGDTAITIRLGRQTLLWGESLFSAENGIAAGQAPVDVVKALSQPLAKAEELFLPVTQAVVNIQLRTGLHLEAYMQGEWRRDRLPGVGSYFSTVDFLDLGGERLFTGASALTRSPDRRPGNLRQFGAALHLDTGDIGLGLYALRFDAKSPALVMDQDHYTLVYPRGIALFGASFSSYLGDSALAGEISFRDHMPLVSVARAVLSPQYATGDSLHAQSSITLVLPPGHLWQGASLLGEVTANERLSVQSGRPALAPGGDRFATAFRIAFEPSYYEVLPHLDLTVPVGLGLNMLGTSSVLADQIAGAGDVEIGLNATWRSNWRGALNVTYFIGKPRQQSLSDRDFLTMVLSRTF